MTKRRRYRGRVKKDKNTILKLRREALPHKDLILKGKVLAIDPSCISSSSLPGWAEFEGGELVAAGNVGSDMNPRAPLFKRLKYLSMVFCTDFEPDVVIIEAINSGGIRSMDSTLKAVGAILSSVAAEVVLEISPRSWQSYVKKNEIEWVKGDHDDAIAIGKTLIGVVEECMK